MTLAARIASPFWWVTNRLYGYVPWRRKRVDVGAAIVGAFIHHKVSSTKTISCGTFDQIGAVAVEDQPAWTPIRLYPRVALDDPSQDQQKKKCQGRFAPGFGMWIV